MNLEDQIKCVTRELAFRRQMYPRWVADGRISIKKATAETQGMQAILETLKACQANQPEASEL